MLTQILAWVPGIPLHEAHHSRLAVRQKHPWSKGGFPRKSLLAKCRLEKSQTCWLLLLLQKECWVNTTRKLCTKNGKQVVRVEGTRKSLNPLTDVKSNHLSAARVEPQAAAALSSLQALLGTRYTQHIASQLLAPSCLYYLCLQRSKNKVLGNEGMDRRGRSRHVVLLSKGFSWLPASTSCQHDTREMLSM